MLSDKSYPLLIKGLARPLELWVHSEGDLHVSRSIAENGIWEVFETQLVLNYLKSGDCFVDVGANIGYYSVLAAEQVGRQGYVAAFEPEPKNFSLLQKNIAHNGYDFIDAQFAGLSNKNTAAKIFLNKTNYGDHQIYDAGEQREACDIQLLNGAEYLSSYIQKIDFLKVDTQGAEFQVIEGLLPLLKKSLPTLKMIVEFWPYGLRKSGSSAHALLDILMPLTLPVHIIDHIEHKLIACTEQQLREWVDMVDANPDDQGFMNIFLGAR